MILSLYICMEPYRLYIFIFEGNLIAFPMMINPIVLYKLNKIFDIMDVFAKKIMNLP